MGLDILCCPECYGQLSEFIQSHLFCPNCNRTFPLRNGIYSFVDSSDDFYEGKFTYTAKVNKGLTNPILKLLYIAYTGVSIDASRERFLKKILRGKRNLVILDLGCGGGREYLNRFGRVIGTDISLASLASAKTIYEIVIHTDVLKLPFFDETFDLVCSTDLIGHIPRECKDQFISEIYRVTKWGGHTGHSIECDSRNLFYQWARRYPDLFRKYFIEMYGHYGLELPKYVFERFRQRGFIPVIEKADPCKGYLRPIDSYVVFFNNEYKEKSVWIKIFIDICRLLHRNRSVRVLSSLILGLFVPLADLITPMDHRDSVKVYYKKQPNIRSEQI